MIVSQKMGNKINKSNIDPDLVQIINADKNLEYILYENKEYNLTNFFCKSKKLNLCKSKKLNLLQRLILSSNNVYIKEYLINNII